MSATRDLAVLIPAGGTGSRFGGDKLSADLAGRTVLARTLDVFLARSDVNRVVVAGPDTLPLPGGDDRLFRVGGGGCRAESVLNALRAAGEASFVAVHDAARPLVTDAVIDRVVGAARETGAAVPGLAATDTLKRVRDGHVHATVDRATVVAVQTPQVVRRDWLLDAYERFPGPLEFVTDDAALLEAAGRRVRVVEGDPRNLKITRPADLAFARWLLTNPSAEHGL